MGGLFSDFSPMRSWSSLNISPTHPTKLTLDEFWEIHELTQDMWADGSSEFIRCYSCHTISGKKEVFGHLPINIYKKKVHTLIDVSQVIICPHCRSSEIELIHTRSQSIETIRERLLTSMESHVVLCRDKQTGELVWYAEAYVAKFEDAHRWELAPHYPRVLVSDMQKRIQNILSVDTSFMIIFSALWLMMEYRNPFIFAELLKQFFGSVWFEQYSLPALMEIWHNNAIYKVFMWLGWQSLNATDPSYFSRHLVASPKYDSTIAVFPIALPLFQKQFAKWSVREILQLI